jgi:hypothetical protein
MSRSVNLESYETRRVYYAILVFHRAKAVNILLSTASIIDSHMLTLSSYRSLCPGMAGLLEHTLCERSIKQIEPASYSKNNRIEPTLTKI